MKRVFFLVVSLVLSQNLLKSQGNSLEFGVLVFCNTEGINEADIRINNIPVFRSSKRTIVYYKLYSAGSILINVSDINSSKVASKVFETKRNDTTFIRIRTTGENSIYYNGYEKRSVRHYDWTIEDISSKKAEELIKEYNLFKFQYEENINEPIIPNTIKYSKLEKKQGSGFLISKNKYLITNYHVVEGTNSISVTGINGNKKSKLSAQVIYADSSFDLALLKLDDDINVKNPSFNISNINSDIGEDIFVLGYPLTNTMGQDIKLTNGLVSSINGFMGDTSTYQISAPVQLGNSGGPLFNKKGELVGIVNAKHKETDNVSYAIKVSVLKKFITDSGVKDIVIETKNNLSTISLSGQVKAIQDFVYIVEAE